VDTFNVSALCHLLAKIDDSIDDCSTFLDAEVDRGGARSKFMAPAVRRGLDVKIKKL
jgi:hypothetical protein